MTIPLLDLKRSLTSEAPGLRAAFERVLQSGHYVNGPEVERFETEIAAYCGTSNAVGVSSGTDALLLALMASDIGPGDEVICPSYSFFASAGSIWRSGATPVFVDNCSGCFNMLPQAAAKARTARTKAVMPVHLFGQCADMAALQAALASQSATDAESLPIIEDAAQAMGAQLSNGKRAGSIGKAGCFSFFPSKNLGALGDGGLITTSNAAFASKLRLLRNHGAHPKYYHAMVGGNFRLDALQAAFLQVKLASLDSATAKRQRNAAQYDELFVESGQAAAGTCTCHAGEAAKHAIQASAQPRITTPVIARSHHVYNQYTVVFDTPERRDRVREHLLACGIGCEIYYPVPLHQQACFATLPSASRTLPHAERVAQCSLALPIFPELSQDEITQVARETLRASDKRLAA